MNILILNWRDPKHPLAGGAEISLYNNALYWKKMGANITWFASSFKHAKRSEDFNGIKIIRRGNHFTVALMFFLAWLSGEFHQNEIIIDSFHFIPFFSPLYIKRKKIVGLINEVAGEVWFDNLILPLAALGYYIEPFIIRLYKKIPFITGSNSAKEDLIKVGIPKKNIKVVAHGFNPLAERKNLKREKDPTILFLGRLSKDKGIEDALLMLELLARDNKKIKLWIVGKFENKNYARRLKGLISEFKVQKHCTFFGYVDEKTKAELLQKVWLLIHPSTKEGWGLNVIEANSVGTPAVGYNVEGLRDSIIDRKTGILVEPDAISLADGVEELIVNAKLRNSLSENAKKWSTQFSWEKAGRESYRVVSQKRK